MGGTCAACVAGTPRVATPCSRPCTNTWATVSRSAAMAPAPVARVLREHFKQRSCKKRSTDTTHLGRFASLLKADWRKRRNMRSNPDARASGQTQAILPDSSSFRSKAFCSSVRLTGVSTTARANRFALTPVTDCHKLAVIHAVASARNLRKDCCETAIRIMMNIEILQPR